MKRKTVAILVCTCLVLSACADNKKEVESDQTESYQMSNNLIYYNLEDIIAFAVDGTDVWTIKENENKIIKYNDSVEKVDEIDTELQSIILWMYTMERYICIAWEIKLHLKK